MSIICYAGLPGDGKSYSAIENVVIEALKQGRHVAHNLQLYTPALNVVTGRDCEPLLHQIGKDDSPDELIKKCPLGAVVVIDEVWKYWPAGMKVSEVPKDQVAFFKEHRHRVGDDGISTEILIIDQDAKTGIPAFIRSLVELTYIHIKHTKLGAKNRFRVDVYTRCQSAEKPSKGMLIRSMQGKYRSEIWNCYVSHTQSKKLGEAGLEKIVDDRGNLWKGWTLKSAVIAAICLPFAVWVGIAAVHRMVDKGGVKGAASEAKPSEHPSRPLPPPPGISAEALPQLVTAQTAPMQPLTAQQPTGQPTSPVTPPKPRDSEKWRYSGTIKLPSGTAYAILTGVSVSRRIATNLCKQDDGGEWGCLVDGEHVTAWTGPVETGVAAWAGSTVLGTQQKPPGTM